MDHHVWANSGPVPLNGGSGGDRAERVKSEGAEETKMDEMNTEETDETRIKQEEMDENEITQEEMGAGTRSSSETVGREQS